MSPILGIFASSISGAVAGDFQAIATATVDSGGASNISFTSIPSTYKHLQIRMLGRDNYSASGGPDNFNIKFNSDGTNTNYWMHALRGNGSSASATSNNYNFVLSSISNNFDAANIFGTSIIDILDYGSTNKNKVVRTLSGVDYNGSGWINLESMIWNNTAAITQIDIYPGGQNWVQNSTFALYGVKG